MMIKIVADIRPYNQKQQIWVYRKQNNNNEIFIYPMLGIIDRLILLYQQENAEELILLGSKKFNQDLANKIHAKNSNIHINIM